MWMPAVNQLYSWIQRRSQKISWRIEDLSTLLVHALSFRRRCVGIQTLLCLRGNGTFPRYPGGRFSDRWHRWRKMRRTSEHALGVRISSNYHDIQSSESALLAHGLLHQTTKWDSHIERLFIIFCSESTIFELQIEQGLFFDDTIDSLWSARYKIAQWPFCGLHERSCWSFVKCNSAWCLLGGYISYTWTSS